MKVTFNINFHTVWGQRLCVVGSIPELGSWELALAKEMNYIGEGNWQLELELPSPVKSIEYRYFLSVNDKRIFEEWNKNHTIVFDDSATRYTLYDYWQIRPSNLAYFSSAFTQSLFTHTRQTESTPIASGKKLILKIAAPRIEKSQRVAITGNQACLGNWQPEKALLLNSDSGPEWHIELDAEEIQYPLEYKFLVWDDEKQQPLYWEADENRMLNLPSQQKGETISVSGLYFRDNRPDWKCAGTVIPVFSLRSEQSFGVGDLGDLKMLVEWAHQTGQRIIQVLPMNDTTIAHSWVDSYPYSAISIYALHPMYINLYEMGLLKQSARADFYAEKQKELNAQPLMDYEAVMHYKMAYCREYFEQEGASVLQSEDFKVFYEQNKEWLLPYAAFCYLRDHYHTADFSQWGRYAVYAKNPIRELCKEGGEAWPAVSYSYFLQFVLHTQFKGVSDYARQHGVVLKGDLPIGVNRHSVEAWTEPNYFNMNGQAGAPPDDFSANGQNWLFPTYNWDVMEKDNFAWWQKRFRKMSDYFDSFRIDHILGFFRIWEIPEEYVQGLCGHFNPALPLTEQEIEQYGLHFNQARFTTPHINEQFLPEIFGEQTEEVKNSYLAQSSSHHFVLKPFCDTQQKIHQLFSDKTDDASQQIKMGLFAIANEVLFLPDPREANKYHPRISASHSYLYKELDSADKYAFDQLYWDFFYHRHNDFWKAQALKRLTPLIECTDMLVCGEDLGMIPESVPDVMNKLQILSLELERMPKEPHREFTDMHNLPYLSVCTTSTHDMSPLRSWWTEDKEKTQRYYNQVLKHEGKAPEECTADLATQILSNHLASNAMLVILPLQDWMAMDDTIKNPDAEMERINIPARTNHYWRYRMHITLEKLLNATDFNTKINTLVKTSGRQ